LELLDKCLIKKHTIRTIQEPQNIMHLKAGIWKTETCRAGIVHFNPTP
jgi:hypothetical protein